MIRIALCDDQPEMTSLIENLIIECSDQKSIDVEIEVFFSGTTLLKHIGDGDCYDLIYLDIEMKVLDGVETAKQIREKDKDVLLIYVSGYESYWKDLFQVEPFRFINKPVDKDEFAEFFYKACERIKGLRVFFDFKYNREIIKVKISDIIYFESCKRAVHIFTNQGESYKFYGKLNEVEEIVRQKNYSFLRIHQSNLVNYRYIKRIGSDVVVLTDDTQLLISGDRQKEVRKKYCNLIGGEFIDL